ncbi:CHAP domain-containing protein [Akkermansiaceae bacterium]|nr:CHAP domain-containing protein [Akkermansiaceae bacterium]
MKVRIPALIVFPWLLVTWVMAVDVRVFTDTTGREITAELQVVMDGRITVKRIDGRVFTIPLDTLSEEDREFCRDWEKRHAGEMREIAEKEAAARLAVQRRAQIVAFCKANLGRQVGNGECWTLANEAFKATGAERPKGQGRVWGKPVDFGKEPLEPGDIVEFEAAQITGYGTTGPNHTAVVVKGGRRGQCTVAEQNWGGVKKVRETPLDLGKLVSGKVMAYRPE